MVAPLIIAGGIAAGTALANWWGNRQQANAARDAAASSNALAREQMAYQREMGGLAATTIGDAAGAARGDLEAGYNYGMEQMRSGYNEGNDSLVGGYGQSIAGINASRGDSLMALYGGYDDARGELGGYGAQALGAMRSGMGQAEGAALGAFGQVGSANVSMDPGMAFRQQQGEQAINRSAAARGGRLGGAQLKALSEFNQGLASQEYGNAWQRANTQEQQRAASLGQLAQMYQGHGMAEAGILQGQGSQLAEMSARSGERISSTEQQYGALDASARQSLAQQLSSHQTGQGVAIYNAATGQGSQLANLGMNAAGQIASGYTGVASQNAQLVPSMMQANQMPVQYAGAGAAGVGQGLNQMGQLYMMDQMYNRGGGGW